MNQGQPLAAGHRLEVEQYEGTTAWKERKQNKDKAIEAIVVCIPRTRKV